MSGPDLTFATGDRYWSEADSGVKFFGLYDGVWFEFILSEEAIQYITGMTARIEPPLGLVAFDTEVVRITDAARGAVERDSGEQDRYVLSRAEMEATFRRNAR